MVTNGLWRYLNINEPSAVELVNLFNTPYGGSTPSRRVGVTLVCSERVEGKSDYVNTIQYSIDGGET